MVARIYVWLGWYLLQLPIKISIASQIDKTVNFFRYVLGAAAVNEVLYSRFKFKSLSLFRSFSTWEKLIIWQPLAVLTEVLSQNLSLSFTVTSKSIREFEWHRVTCWNGQEKLLKTSGFFTIVLKLWQKNTILRSSTRVNNFSKVFLHFKEITNSLRKVLKT